MDALNQLSGLNQSFIPSYPYHLIWGITNACGCRCTHCYADSGKRLSRELDTEEAIEVLDDVASCGVFDIGFTGGEPLLRKDIHTLISHATSEGLTVGLSSSGHPLTRQLAESLRKCGLERIQISIDGVGISHDRFRGVSGLYEKAINALQVCRDVQLPHLVCFTASSTNFAQLPYLLKVLRNLEIDTLNISLFIPTGRGDRMLALTPQQQKSLYEFWKAQRNSGELPNLVFHTGKMALLEGDMLNYASFSGCQAGRGTAYLDPQGNVTPCVLLPVTLGNVRDKPFSDIWRNSDLVLRLKDRNIKGHCANCSHSDKCGGCRAMAFSYFNDPLAEDPSCWLHSDKGVVNA